jgi:hypothetical protein
VSSYTSPDEARSDLFLSGAAYLFGGTVLALLFGVTGLGRLPGLSLVLAFAVPLLTTVVVPVLLMRYRGESLRDLGIGGEGDGSIGPALLAAGPLVVAAVATAALTAQPLSTQVPALQIGGPTIPILAEAVYWIGLLFLALYGTVKARDAFRGETVRLEDAVVRIGRFVGIACGGALVLLILANLNSFSGGEVLALLAYPLGVAAAVTVALRVTPGSSTTTMPVVLTPAILLALGPFGITFDARRLVLGIFAGALYAGIGLVVAVLSERTRRGAGVLLIGVVLAFAVRLAGAGAAL